MATLCSLLVVIIERLSLSVIKGIAITEKGTFPDSVTQKLNRCI